MEPFCKLAAPDRYVHGDWDLVADDAGRAAWLKIFDEHTDSLIDHARRSFDPPPDRILASYAGDFRDLLDQIAADPAAHAPLTIYLLCKYRADALRDAGIGDPYDRVKADENDAALRHWPQVVSLLDDAPDERRVELLIRGVLAGNKFDLGAKDTTEQHAAEGIDFFRTLDELPQRPWFVDDLDQLRDRLAPGACSYRKAIFFIDNAGGDIVLGALPLTRYLADQGCQVVLAANDEPSLNDVTLAELNALLPRAASSDAQFADYLASERIRTVGTGCDCPLIDLGNVSAACNAAAADADLVILEGMGRAIESNFNTPMTCDAIRLAMIKNRGLAAFLGCNLFDLVARFTPGAGVS